MRLTSAWIARGGLLLLALCGACGPEGTLVIVEVREAPEEVELLKVRVSFAAKQETREVRDRFEFGVQLPEGAQGRIFLEADGLSPAGCIVATGRTDTTLSGRSLVRLHLPMVIAAPPRCAGP